MLEATPRDRAKSLLTASGRSDVPPFMVMDVMAAAARIEGAGAPHQARRRPCHSYGGRTPLGSGAEGGDRGRPCRPRRRPYRLYLGAWCSLAAPAHRRALPRDLRL